MKLLFQRRCRWHCLALLLAGSGLAQNPVTTPSVPATRLSERILPPRPMPPLVDGRVVFGTNEVIVLVGPENAVTEQRSGWIESALTAGLHPLKPRFRPMSWEGDTVYRQNRMQNWGSWRENLEAVDATLVLAWFGQLEAFDQARSVGDFTAAYATLLDELAARNGRIVVLSPTPFERPADPRIPDNTVRNDVVRQHAAAAGRLARDRGHAYVDLFTPLSRRPAGAPPLTRDGVHLNEDGLQEIARLVITHFGLPVTGIDGPLRAAVIEKNRTWFDTWRPINWAFAYGDRTTQPFAQGPGGRLPFVEELQRFRPLLTYGDAKIQALASGGALPAVPAPEPVRADPPAASPEEERSRFQLREGFAVNLFADEHLGVVRPVQIRWDERGRLWVICAPSYPQPQPGEPANDYIQVLEDTDGDGKADKATRFAGGLTMPMGLEFGDDGVYVCEGTQLIHLRDRDGDGRADERRVVLSGFGTGDSHQTINSIRWEPDGRLWFTQGYHIWSAVETPHGIVELSRSGLWRFNPRTLKLEGFLNESTAGLNCWGVTFDDHGQVFHGSGADFVLWHTTPALIPTLHPLSLGPGLAASKGKSMEPEFLGDSHLPPDLQGVVLKSIYFTSQIRLYRLRDEGAGFASEDLGDLISSTGTEFRPLETRVGPDGAIYICDWLNPVIGHYQASYRDPRRDRTHGRIWRMTAKGRPLLRRPRLEEMNAAQLTTQLDSPERWVRDQARFALFRHPKAEAIAAADALLAREDGRTDAGARRLYEISGVFAAHEESRPALVERLFASEDFRWRAWAVRLVGLWADRLADPLAILGKAVADEHPRVRLEAVVAAAQVPSPDSMKVASLVMDRSVDASINHALTQCIHALAPYWQPALASGRLDFGPRVHALARVLTAVGDTNIVGRVRGLLETREVSGPPRESLLAVLVDQGGPGDAEFALRDSPESERVLNALANLASRRQAGNYQAVVNQLLTSPQVGARVAGYRLAGDWGRDFGQLPGISRTAADGSATPRERAAAVTALARIRSRDGLTELLPFLDAPEVEVRSAAFAALAPLDVGGVAEKVARRLATVESEAEAGQLLAALLAVRGGSAALTAALQRNQVQPGSARLALRWLGRTGHDDPALVGVLRVATGTTPTRLEYSAERIGRWVREAQESGDAGRGRALVHSEDLACLGCHRIGNEGGPTDGLAWAPDLTSLGRGLTPDLIVEAVFWPKRQVKEGFLLTTVTTRDGRQAQGYKVTETAGELRLRQLDGGELVVRKADLESRDDSGTLMSDGLTDALTDSQRRDLLRYLFELGR